MSWDPMVCLRGAAAPAALVFFLGAVLACDSRGATSDAAGVTPADASADGLFVAFAELPTAIGQAICERRWACCSMAERARSGEAPDQATCAARMAVGFNLLLPALQASVAAGRAGYDGAALGRCLQATGQLSCPTARAGVPESISLTGCPYLVARLPLGAACGQGFECIGGYCAGVRVNGDGQCVGKKADGAPCQTLDECLSNNCDLDSEVCAPVVARPLCRPAD